MENVHASLHLGWTRCTCQHLATVAPPTPGCAASRLLVLSTIAPSA